MGNIGSSVELKPIIGAKNKASAVPIFTKANVNTTWKKQALSPPTLWKWNTKLLECTFNIVFGSPGAPVFLFDADRK